MGKENQEMETSYMVENVIRKMLKLADKYIDTFGLECLSLFGRFRFYFKSWNMLAFGELPLVIAFAAVGSQIQFYYYHVVESLTTPKRERIGDVLSLGTEVKRNNFLASCNSIYN
ncbi:unnamed protein product [Rhizophagus irregularis]|nr:unnamed protein product [Rhizophagus irregularis]CAB4408584.1 unnamed protein product [Rhizophagus irregularis]